MAWIESHQSLGSHIKLRRLARALGVHKAQAIGHLHYLWWWALDCAPSGDVSSLAASEIAEVAEWPGEPEPFVAALRECGWLDPDGRIHDWDQYVGRILAFREGNRKRQRRYRNGTRRRQRNGPGNGDVTVMSPLRNGYVTGLPTVPTVPTIPTVPTVPVCESHTACVSHTGDAHLAETHTAETHPPDSTTDLPWPTLEEARQRADIRGIPKDCAEKWWHLNDSRGGCDQHGQPIRRWESSLVAFAATWRAVEAQHKARTDSRPAARVASDHSKGFFHGTPFEQQAALMQAKGPE